MKIELRKMRLTNFKGFKSFEIDFTDRMVVSGMNATGKTTIFDAFLWVLFGKDSQGRSDFAIKTLDANNVAIPRIDHEVELTLLINGETTVVRRCLREKWVKRKGSTIEEMTGNETEYFHNDVPLSMKEYQTKINDICNENVFKLVTSPLYFPSLPWKEQRNIVLSMAGDVSDESILLRLNGSGEILRKILSQGKDFESYKKEIAAKKKIIKDEIEKIPARIDEVQRATPQTSDFSIAEIELDHKKHDLDQIDTQITDRSKAHQLLLDNQLSIQKQINELELKKSKIVGDAKLQAQQKSNEVILKNRGIESEIQTLKFRLNTLPSLIKNVNTSINNINDDIIKCRKQWHDENEKVFVPSETKCPTCGHPFEQSRIAEMEAGFNTNKAKTLADITQKGQGLKSELDVKTSELKSYEDEDKQAVNKISELSSQIIPVLPTDDKPTLTDEMVAEISNIDSQIKQLQDSLSQEPKLNIDDLKEKKQPIIERIDQLKHKLNEKTIIETNNKRIEELKEQNRTMSQKLADMEKAEFAILEFNKTKIESVEELINSKFSMVRFKMFETQLNGGENEVCEAIYNGVPWSNLNHAAQINTGMDILNTLSKYYDVYAPVFVDNSEAVNQIMEIDSQIIQLRVTEDKVLSYGTIQ